MDLRQLEKKRRCDNRKTSRLKAFDMMDKKVFTSHSKSRFPVDKTFLLLNDCTTVDKFDRTTSLRGRVRRTLLTLKAY